MENNNKELKKAKDVVRLIITKELLNKKTDLKNNKQLKEKIENLFKCMRLEIIESASLYKHNDKEDFTKDIIDGIFSDKEIFSKYGNNTITYNDLLDICGKDYKEEFFINPINAYKKAADRLEELYKEAFNALGMEGIKAIFLTAPRILKTLNKKTNELVKVSEDIYEEAIIINKMISREHGFDYEESNPDFCEKLYAYFKQKREDEERNRKYTHKKI